MSAPKAWTSRSANARAHEPEVELPAATAETILLDVGGGVRPATPSRARCRPRRPCRRRWRRAPARRPFPTGDRHPCAVPHLARPARAGVDAVPTPTTLAATSATAAAVDRRAFQFFRSMIRPPGSLLDVRAHRDGTRRGKRRVNRWKATDRWRRPWLQCARGVPGPRTTPSGRRRQPLAPRRSQAAAGAGVPPREGEPSGHHGHADRRGLGDDPPDAAQLAAELHLAPPQGVGTDRPVNAPRRLRARGRAGGHRRRALRGARPTGADAHADPADVVATLDAALALWRGRRSPISPTNDRWREIARLEELAVGDRGLARRRAAPAVTERSSASWSRSRAVTRSARRCGVS